MVIVCCLQIRALIFEVIVCLFVLFVRMFPPYGSGVYCVLCLCQMLKHVCILCVAFCQVDAMCVYMQSVLFGFVLFWLLL